MLSNLGSEIERYAADVEESLPEYDDHYEVTALFALRDVIEDALDASGRITGSQERTLAQADAAIVKLRKWLVSAFPDVFDPARKDSIPPRYWWWHLDEGPEVREQAKAAEASSMPGRGT